jgi:dTDP-4-amino-4,6-dideoxygalactose transaminase
MDSIWQLAARYGLWVVEDAAHAVGAIYRGNFIGAGQSEATVFSFYATKNLTTGEGGMITTASAPLADRMRLLCLHGISADGWKRYADVGRWYYEVLACGFKYNLSDILAAIGIQQLRRLEHMTARRAEIAAAYNDAFRDEPGLELPPVRDDSRHCWHLYVLRLNLDSLKINRDRFIEEMRLRGIGCSVHFIPIPLHPYYSRTMAQYPCPRALAEYPRLVSLPLYSRMADTDIDRVIVAVKDVAYASFKPKYLAVGA